MQLVPHPKFPDFNKLKDTGKEFKGKVAIIGAGAAGLFAANTLKYMGFDDFVVYEASDRIGGRVKSADNFHDQVPLELGAEWIHAPTPQYVKDMTLFKNEEQEKMLQDTEFIKYQPQWYFGNSKSWLLNMMYQETKWKSSTWWHYLNTCVYSHVQDKVELNSPVKTVNYACDGKVKLIMQDGTEHVFDKVICTIPLAVLKNDDIVKFDPSLPEEKRDAINAVKMPGGMRVLFEMKEKFYPDVTVIEKGRLGMLMDPDNICLLYDPLYGKELSSKQNILAFVAIGTGMGELENMDGDKLVKAILAKVDKQFNGLGTKNYVKHEVQNWTTEPYIRGTYSFSGSSKKHRAELGRTVNGNLLFAGEHTSRKYYSLVDGAAFEGQRAAVEAVAGIEVFQSACI